MISRKNFLKATIGCVALVALPSVAFAQSGAPAAGQSVIFGNYGEAILSMPFNPANGQVDTTTVVSTPANKASWLVLDSNRQQLFAVAEQGSPSTTTVGQVSAFRYKNPAQAFTRLNTQQTRGNEPTHASQSPDGKYLLVANYAVDPNPGGSLVVLPIATDGSLMPVSQLIRQKPSNVNPQRQASSHIHQVLFTPDKKFVIANDLGGDRTYVYRWDPATDPARPLGEMNGSQKFVQLPPGSGPRHMAFSADGQHAYLTLEMAGALAVFDLANGVFTQRGIISLAPQGFTGKVAGGEVGFSPDNQFLYVTDRGDDNSILVYSLDSTGLPVLVQRRSAEGREPRSFQFSPDGRYFLVANQFSNQVVTFERDTATGQLGKAVQRINMTGPSFITFPPLSN